MKHWDVWLSDFFLVVVAIVAADGTRRALKAGYIHHPMQKRGQIERASHPMVFWLVIVFYATIGIAALTLLLICISR